MRFTLKYPAALALIVGLGQASAEVVIDYDTTIDYTISDDVRVIEGGNPSPPTVVDIVEPAEVSRSVRVFDSSIVNFRGGTIHGYDDQGLTARDTSTVNMYGGTISDELSAVDFSTVNVHGGYVSDADTGGSGTLNIYGGEVGGPNATDTCVVNIFGGDIDGVRATQSGTVNIHGGNIVSEVRAGSGFGDHDGVITVFGAGFNYPYGPIPDSSGTLTGNLADGSPIDVSFEIYDDASIVLAVPEPASVVLLTAGAGGLLAFARRRKR